MNFNNVLVSVIVPVYGTEAYLPVCIESICAQSHQNLQVILVDDQSPDRCPELCERYAQADPRVLVIHQENQGVSGARNTGLAQASGEYILFVDSDDILYPGAVEILLSDAQNYGADIVWAPFKQICKNSVSVCTDREEGYTVYQNDDSLLLSLNGTYNINSVCGKLFKTAFVSGIQFERGKDINEDGFFMFQCYMRRPLFIRHEVPVYQYNNRLDSNSRQQFSDKFLSMLYFCERKKELISSYRPQYMDHALNMEVRTNLQLLDVLCRTVEKKYKPLQKQCVDTVRSLCSYHTPINRHHKRLAWIVVHGLYPLYKCAVRLKYYM